MAALSRYNAVMGIVLSITVTLSLLAGQACGGGIGVFHPLKTDEGEQMSRAVMGCIAERGDDVNAPNADCGPGQCLEGGGDDQHEVAVSFVQPEPTCPPRPTLVSASKITRIAFSEPRNIPIDRGQLSSVVKIE